MKLSPVDIDRLIDEHFAYEANDNVEGVLATLAPDVEHDVIGSPTGPVHGREATRPFYEGLFADLSEGKVETQRRLYGDNFAIDESLWRGRAPGKPFGIDGRNRELAFRLLHIFEFNDAGMIARENVWLDLGAIQQQLLS